MENEDEEQPSAEIGEMQKNVAEIVQTWQFVKEGEMPVDPGLQGV